MRVMAILFSSVRFLYKENNNPGGCLGYTCELGFFFKTETERSRCQSTVDLAG